MKEKKNEGSTPYIKLNTLQNMEIMLPILEEQEKIVKILSNADKKIELIDYQISQMEQFKKGLLQQMFV